MAALKFAREDFLAAAEVAPEGYFDPVSRVFLRTTASKDELGELLELLTGPA